MDNGLIFPYPCKRAHGESVILTALKPANIPSGMWSGDARDLIW
jgi:hypothetical protein